MRNIRNLMYFLIGFLAMCILGISTANAASYDGLDHINRIIQNAKGVTTVATSSGGVAVTASGAVDVTTKAGKIAVPTSFTANIGRRGVAKVAARAASRIIGAVGVAVTAYEVYKWYVDSGIYVCPPEDGFFCKPISTTSAHVYYRNGSPSRDKVYLEIADACNAWLSERSADYQSRYPSYAGFEETVISNRSRFYCLFNKADGGILKADYFFDSNCPASKPYVVDNYCSATPTNEPMSEPDLTDHADDYIEGNPNSGKDVWDGSWNDYENNPNVVDMPEISGDTEIQVDAPPVQTDWRDTGTTTKTLDDGSTQETTTKERTVVIPEISGTTKDDIKIQYIPTTETTTTTTTTAPDGSTSTSTETRTTIEPAATPSTQTQSDYPTDYNREETQKEIKDILDCSQPENADLFKCQTIGETPPDVPPAELPVEEISGSFSVLPFATNKSCPADVTYDLMGNSYTYSWAPLCDSLLKVRPIFIAFGTITASYMFLTAFGVGRKS